MRGDRGISASQRTGLEQVVAAGFCLPPLRIWLQFVLDGTESDRGWFTHILRDEARPRLSRQRTGQTCVNLPLLRLYCGSSTVCRLWQPTGETLVGDLPHYRNRRVSLVVAIRTDLV